MDQDRDSPARRSGGRWAGAAAVVALSALVAGCGGGAPSASGTAGRTTKLLNEGLAAQRAGRYAQADAAYLDVVRLDHVNVYAWYNLGVIAEHRGDASAASYDYRQAVAADPRYVPALYNLATVQAATNPAAAVLAYEAVVKLAPNDAAAHFNLGLALEATGQGAQGRAEIARAVALDPGLAGRARTAAAAPQG